MAKISGPKVVIQFNLFHPLMNPLFAMLRKGGAEEIALAADAAKNAFPEWRDLTGTERKKNPTQDRGWHRCPRRRDRPVRKLGHRSTHSIYGQGRDPRCREFSVLR